MVDVSGLKKEHFDALEKIQKKLFGDVDGRLMRPLTRRGFAISKKPGQWSLTPSGRKALEVR